MRAREVHSTSAPADRSAPRRWAPPSRATRASALGSARGSSAGADPDEHFAIIDDRNEILIDRQREQLLDFSIDSDGTDVGTSLHRLERDLFGLVEAHVGMLLHEPEEIPLGQRAHVLAVVREDQNRGVAVVLHPLDGLANGRGGGDTATSALGVRKNAIFMTTLDDRSSLIAGSDARFFENRRPAAEFWQVDATAQFRREDAKVASKDVLEVSFLVADSDAHFQLIEKRHRLAIPRETLPGWSARDRDAEARPARRHQRQTEEQEGQAPRSRREALGLTGLTLPSTSSRWRSVLPMAFMASVEASDWPADSHASFRRIPLANAVAALGTQSLHHRRPAHRFELEEYAGHATLAAERYRRSPTSPRVVAQAG